MEPKTDRLDIRKCLAIVACQQAGKYDKLINDLRLMRVGDEAKGMDGTARDVALQTDNRNPHGNILVLVRSCRRARTRLRKAGQRSVNGSR